MVYSFLRVYVPKDRVSCNEDIVLVLQDYSCLVDSQILNITLLNKGLFKADAVYLRFGNESQKIREQINKENFLLYGAENRRGLNPGESSSSSYNLTEITSVGQYILEIQPAVIMDKQLVVCENAIITLPIQCS